MINYMIITRGEQKKSKPKNWTEKPQNLIEKPVNWFDFSKKFGLVNWTEKIYSFGFAFGSTI